MKNVARVKVTQKVRAFFKITQIKSDLSNSLKADIAKATQKVKGILKKLLSNQTPITY